MTRRIAFIAFAAAWSAPLVPDIAWSAEAPASSGDAVVNEAAAQATAENPAGADIDLERHNPKVDPWERANRGLFGLNNVLDRIIFRPVAMTYRRVLPRFARNAVHNVVQNLNEPGIVINDVLQGKVVRGASSSLRFVANTTVGVAGIFDVAKHAGLPYHSNDFGLTLGKWNLESGPYVYVPVAGPSSVRDLTGTVVDFFIDPISWVDFRDSDILFTSKAIAGALDGRVRADPAIKKLDAVAIDPYATLRSVYLQSRESEVHDGAIDVDALPDFPDEAPIPSTEPEAPAMAEPPAASPVEATPAAPSPAQLEPAH